MKTKEVDGKTLSGEPRKYTFNLLDAETGLRLFHEYAGVIFSNKDMITQISTGGDATALSIIGLLPRVLPWDKIKELAAALLNGAKIDINGTVCSVGETGIGYYCEGDPLELYTALFYAIKANYPKYIDPLFQAVPEEDDLLQDTAPEKKSRK